MKYIDAEKLKRFVESIGLIPQTSADYNDGRDDVKMMVLDFIDYLQQEQPEVDLEKEVERFAKECGYPSAATIDFQFAHHFYELGLNARKV